MPSCGGCAAPPAAPSATRSPFATPGFRGVRRRPFWPGSDRRGPWTGASWSRIGQIPPSGKRVFLVPIEPADVESDSLRVEYWDDLTRVEVHFVADAVEPTLP